MLILHNETHAGKKAAHGFLRGRQLDDIKRCDELSLQMQIRVQHKHIVTLSPWLRYYNHSYVKKKKKTGKDLYNQFMKKDSEAQFYLLFIHIDELD